MGPGLLESVYEICLYDLLQEQSLKVEKQRMIPVTFRGKILESGFRTDLIIENCVLVELKSIEKIMPVHEARILTYLRLSQIKLGLLLNFNAQLLKQGIKCFVKSENP